MNAMRVFFRNDSEGTYFEAEVDPRTKEVLSPIHDWQPDPATQIIRQPGNKLIASCGGADMPPWLLRLIRKYGYKLTQSELGDLLGVSLAAVSYWEKLPARHGIPPKHLPKIYEVLRIDHRPAEPTPKLLRRVKNFLGLQWKHMAALLSVSECSMKEIYTGRQNVGPEVRNHFYALYCVLPDLTKEELPAIADAGAQLRNDA